jgi:hypothetical protein
MQDTEYANEPVNWIKIVKNRHNNSKPSNIKQTGT